MGPAIYKILPFEGGWGVAHDGDTTGPCATKEVAFEATAAAASIAMHDGHSIEITGARPRCRPARSHATRIDVMLRWALLFFLISLAAAALGFTDIAAGAASIAKVLFAVFMVIFLIFLVLGIMAGEAIFR
jgi:uncharacterized membrane protein YtjA (UPF0391 family)